MPESVVVYNLAKTRGAVARYLQTNLRMGASEAASLANQITGVWKQSNVANYSTIGSGGCSVRSSTALLQHLLGPERYLASQPLPPLRLTSGIAEHSEGCFEEADLDYCRSHVVEHLNQHIGLELAAAVAAASGLVRCGKRVGQPDDRKMLFWTARTPLEKPIQNTVALLTDLVGGEATPDDLAKLERRTRRAPPTHAGGAAGKKARKMCIKFRRAGTFAEADVDHCRAQLAAHLRNGERRVSADEAVALASRLVQVRVAVEQPARRRCARVPAVSDADVSRQPRPASEFYARTVDGAVCRTANRLMRCVVGDALFRRELDDCFRLNVRPAEDSGMPLEAAPTPVLVAVAHQMLSDETTDPAPSSRGGQERDERRSVEDAAETQRLREEIAALRALLAGENARMAYVASIVPPGIVAEAERRGREVVVRDLVSIMMSEGFAFASAVLCRIVARACGSDQ